MLFVYISFYYQAYIRVETCIVTYIFSISTHTYILTQVMFMTHTYIDIYKKY